MAFSLEDVVPWGRSFDDYQQMFALDEKTLSRKILGCADGPASFNAQASAQGCDVTSCDPLFAFSAPDIEKRINEVYPVVLEQTRKNWKDFSSRHFATADDICQARLQAMKTFLADYSQGPSPRYVNGALPSLPFGDDEFEVGLCSHFLFLYSEHFDAEFHITSILELLRVCREVRVFPLTALDGKPSPHLPAVLHAVADIAAAEVLTVDYEVQRGSSNMLRLSRSP